MKVFITGFSGFVGSSVIKYYNDKLIFINYKVNNKQIPIDIDVFMHFAGKAHDLKFTQNFQNYYEVNTELTKEIFDIFLSSNAKIFITLSSVKAVADNIEYELTEDFIPNPLTHYGKSKLLAEQYIMSKKIPKDKRVYILRPSMIHGPGNKGNLNLLFNFVKKGFPWPLGAFENERSFCSIENLCFTINELIYNNTIPSGVYNIADDEPLSTNLIIKLIADSQHKKTQIWKIPRFLIYLLSKIGDRFNLPLNSERLGKLTESYVVSNKKLKSAIKKSFPCSSTDGLITTLNSFSKNVK